MKRLQDQSGGSEGPEVTASIFQMSQIKWKENPNFGK